MNLVPIVNVGRQNFVLTNEILALLDYRSAAARKLMRELRASPDASTKIIDLSAQQKKLTIVLLRNGSVVVTNESRIKLRNRLLGSTESNRTETPETSD